MASVNVTHFTDPGCPWAWSATPSLAVLRWRFGAQLEWRHVMIGLRETTDGPPPSGYTPERAALGWQSFRRFGMPFAPVPKSKVSATSPACRAIVAARLADPSREWAVLRALQTAQFTTPTLLENPDDLRTALADVPGIDAEQIVAAIESDAVLEAYASDCAQTRGAEGTPTHAQGRHSDRGGAVRYTAPSIVFEQDGRSLEVGGFQPLEAYDTALANLDVSLERRDPPEDPVELLDAFPDGLFTAEVAALIAQRLAPIDHVKAEAAMISAVANGQARRVAAGDSALWLKARTPSGTNGTGGSTQGALAGNVA
jgi:protein-disulfide isomerase-like protein with CxxC motif